MACFQTLNSIAHCWRVLQTGEARSHISQVHYCTLLLHKILAMLSEMQKAQELSLTINPWPAWSLHFGLRPEDKSVEAKRG